MIPNTFEDATNEQIEEAMQQAAVAFEYTKHLSLAKRKALLYSIATQIEQLGDALIQEAVQETHLPFDRLKNERDRTLHQLRSYGEFCAGGQWLDVRIDNEANGKDIRKTMVGLGPVVVFGASNFPFAYSTAGGDTACALAAGCPVIVKAHPAHGKTSEMVAGAILQAVRDHALPAGTFAHLHGGNQLGEILVKHPITCAVGFTGSFGGGKQLFDWGNAREKPIPVFSEMGSVNPVFLLPQKMEQEAAAIGETLAASVLMSVGQFCTNPGVIVGIDNQHLDACINTFSQKISAALPGHMLTTSIYKSYVEKRGTALAQPAVEILAAADAEAGLDEGTPTLAATTASEFIENKILQQEVFGPYSIVVKCKDISEMEEVAAQMEGQLTATLMATTADLAAHKNLISTIQNICGRFICNDVPTGVQVSLAMHHGGPFPATTDCRFTAVGGDGIKRFARPVAFQNWPNEALPQELQDGNPTGIWRTINGNPGKI